MVFFFIGDNSDFKQALLNVNLYLRGEGGNSQTLIYREVYGMCSKSDNFTPKYNCPPDQPEGNKMYFNIKPYHYLPKASIYDMSMARNLR